MAEQVLTLFLENHSLDEILAGAPIEFDEVPDEDREALVTAMIHCCVNGPVSPHKETNFPIIGRTSIDQLVGHEVSNNGLRKSCEFIANWLKEQDYQKGYMLDKYGDFWPLNDFKGNQ